MRQINGKPSFRPKRTSLPENGENSLSPCALPLLQSGPTPRSESPATSDLPATLWYPYSSRLKLDSRCIPDSTYLSAYFRRSVFYLSAILSPFSPRASALCCLSGTRSDGRELI